MNIDRTNAIFFATTVKNFSKIFDFVFQKFRTLSAPLSGTRVLTTTYVCRDFLFGLQILSGGTSPRKPITKMKGAENPATFFQFLV